MLTKILLGILGLILTLALVLGVTNYFTVYPTMYFLRFVAAQDKEFVKVGDFATDISQVEIKRTILIEDEDIYHPLPSTTVTLYGLKDVKTPQPMIYFIHGGGWSLGDQSVLSEYMKLLASNGYLVAGVNYALAPEHPYPTSTKQLVMSLNHLNDHADKYNIDRENIFIMGNSAGAHLSAQLGALITNEDYAYQLGVNPSVDRGQLKGLILYNGVYDFALTKDNKFPFFSKFMWSYTGRKDYLSYDRLEEMSPLYHLTKDYPNTFITAGNTDPIGDQTDFMIDALDKQSLKYQSMLWDDDTLDLNHDFMFNLNEKPSQEVYQQVVEFLKENTK